MKTDVTTPGTYLQSKALGRESTAKKLIGSPVPGKDKLPVPDYKLDLSSKTPQTSIPSLPSLPPVPDLPSTPDLLKPEAPSKPSESVKESLKEEVVKKAEKVTKVEFKEGSMKRPSILFIKGLDAFFSPLNSEGGYAGVGRMAEAVEGARIYGWDQKEEIMDEIKKTHKDYPVVLVGHSLGGDTAIEIADELDSIEGNFRSIDLLVTMDAIGFSHDVIPQNVKRHLNIFGESSFALKDGPHVARREEMTKVRNILSPHDHTDIDDDRETQFEIITLIQNTLKEKKQS